MDTLVLKDFRKGEWQEAVIDMANTDLKLVRGNGPVLPNVYEMRLDFNYRPGQKDIEIWLDNIGWE